MMREFAPETAAQRLRRYEALYYGLDALDLVASAHGRANRLSDGALAIDNALQALLYAQIRFANAQIAGAAAKHQAADNGAAS